MVLSLVSGAVVERENKKAVEMATLKVSNMADKREILSAVVKVRLKEKLMAVGLEE